jgi:hypothetical protein
MLPWGLPGGGPVQLEQQIDQMIDYLWSMQLPERR